MHASHLNSVTSMAVAIPKPPDDALELAEPMFVVGRKAKLILLWFSSPAN
jgi:hypothetical protein